MYDFFLKMSKYFQYLQNELKHFGQEILVVYGVLWHFKLYQVFMYNFCAKLVWIFSNIYFVTNVPKNKTRKNFEKYQDFELYQALIISNCIQTESIIQ